MWYTQLHTVNTVFVQTPGGKLPLNLQESHEVAQPEKLLAVIDAKSTPWKQSGSHFYKFIPWSHTFRCGVEALGFYVLVCDQNLFDDLTVDNIAGWLENNGDQQFCISCPVLRYEDNVYTLQSNPFRDNYVWLENAATLKKNKMDWSVCNGTSIIIAFHRMGFLDDQTSIDLLRKFIDQHGKYPKNIIMPIYVWTNTVHIADQPFLYACMGKTTHINVILFLLKVYHVKPSCMLYERIMYQDTVYTTATVARLPHITRDQLLHFDLSLLWKTSTTDVMENNISGLFGLILSEPSMFDWWNTSGKKYMSNILDCIAGFTQENALTYLMKILFHYGSEMLRDAYPIERVRKVWQHVLSVYDREYIPKWFKKYLRLMRRQDKDDAWMAEPPHEFLEDISQTYDIFATRIYHALKCFDHCTNIGRYTSHLDAKMAKRLSVLRSICPHNAAWDSLQQYLRDNRTCLYI